MTFEEFKEKVEKFEGASTSLNGHLVYLTYKSMWSRFPVNRVDKMKDLLINIEIMDRLDNPTKPLDKDFDPTQPFPQLKLFD